MKAELIELGVVNVMMKNKSWKKPHKTFDPKDIISMKLNKHRDSRLAEISFFSSLQKICERRASRGVEKIWRIAQKAMTKA
jgi:hypothetical protein